MKKIANLIFLTLLFVSLISCDNIGEFNEGMALVKDSKTGKYGYLNENKELVIAKKYDYAKNFINGFAVVEIDRDRGLINKKGEIVIPIQFDIIRPLNEKYFKVYKNGKVGVYSSDNEEVIPTVANDIIKVYDGGFFEVKLSSEENSVSLFNKDGERVTESIYKEVSNVQGDFAIMHKEVIEEKYSSKIKRKKYKIYDIVDSENTINIMSAFDLANIINESDVKSKMLFRVGNTSNGGGKKNKISIINYIGETIIPFDKYYFVSSFSENRFTVSTNGETIGYADINGELVIKPIFKSAGKFVNGIADVKLLEKSFSIDMDGNCVSECPTDKWLKFHEFNDFKVNKLLYDSLVKRGIRVSKSENYQTSINIFTDAIKENPAHYEAYHNRGLSRLLIGDLEGAKEDLSMSIKYNETYADSYYLRANVLQKTGYRFDPNPKDDLLKVIELNPYHIEAYMKLAIIYGKDKNQNKFCYFIEKACRLGASEACHMYSKYCP